MNFLNVGYDGQFHVSITFWSLAVINLGFIYIEWELEPVWTIWQISSDE